MLSNSHQTKTPSGGKGERWFWMSVSAGAVVVLLLGLLWPRQPKDRLASSATATARADGTSSDASTNGGIRPRVASGPASGRTAEEIVANKVSQFVQKRRETLYAIARRHNLEVPADMERFFDVAGSGNWEELEKTFKALQARRRSGDWPSELNPLWPVIMETFGVAEEAHNWPA